MNSTDHFNKIGLNQGRSYSCAPVMTDTMMTRFGLSTMQVTKSVGANRSPENLVVKAKKYWASLGSSASNQGSSWNGESNPSRCADSPSGKCNTCIGTVYLTLDLRPDNGKTIGTLEEAL